MVTLDLEAVPKALSSLSANYTAIHAMDPSVSDLPAAVPTGTTDLEAKKKQVLYQASRDPMVLFRVQSNRVPEPPTMAFFEESNRKFFQPVRRTTQALHDEVKDLMQLGEARASTSLVSAVSTHILKMSAASVMQDSVSGPALRGFKNKVLDRVANSYTSTLACLAYQGVLRLFGVDDSVIMQGACPIFLDLVYSNSGAALSHRSSSAMNEFFSSLVSTLKTPNPMLSALKGERGPSCKTKAAGGGGDPDSSGLSTSDKVEKLWELASIMLTWLGASSDPLDSVKAKCLVSKDGLKVPPMVFTKNQNFGVAREWFAAFRAASEPKGRSKYDDERHGDRGRGRKRSRDDHSDDDDDSNTKRDRKSDKNEKEKK